MKPRAFEERVEGMRATLIFERCAHRRAVMTGIVDGNTRWACSTCGWTWINDYTTSLPQVRLVLPGSAREIERKKGKI